MKTSDHLWRASTREEWLRFMSHDKDNPSRQAAYKAVFELLTRTWDFAEIGFGNCLDFRAAWKPAHDEHRLRYRGFDLSKQFCNYASSEFPGYEFNPSGFAGLFRFPAADVVFVRHVFEHAPPEQYAEWIRSALRFAKRSAVIAWFLAPQEDEHLAYPGAWNNTYCRATVQEIIRREGFRLGIQKLSASEHIYTAIRA